MTFSVLILCTGNSCRSQMAEAILRAKRPDIHVSSAGTRPAAEVSPYALRVLHRTGYNTDGLYPKHVDTLRDYRFDLVLTVCDNASAECPVFSNALRTLHHNFRDPYNARGSDAEILEEYELIRREMDVWLERIVRDNIPTG